MSDILKDCENVNFEVDEYIRRVKAERKKTEKIIEKAKSGDEYFLKYLQNKLKLRQYTHTEIQQAQRLNLFA